MPSQASLHEEVQPFLSRDQLEGEAEQVDYDFVEDYVKKRKRNRLSIVIVLSLLLLAGVGAAIYFVANGSTNETRESHDGIFHTAAVAADSALCSKVGRDILLQGGNGVDAAIATMLCSGLTCPHSTGIGGGFFMTIYNRTTGETTTINAREVAPGAATEGMFVAHPQNSSEGGLSIGVMGEVKGYWHAHSRYGSLAWKDLFQPAIKMAERGFPVPQVLADTLVGKMDSLDRGAFSIFINPQTGKFYKSGEVMKRPKLAKTLRVISEEGPDAFYQGSLTENLLADLADAESIITRKDLTDYKVLEKEPLEIQLLDKSRLLSLHAPSGFPVLAFILGVLDGYQLTPKDISSEASQNVDLPQNCRDFKFAYALRSHLGDEDFIDVADLVSNMTSREFTDHIRTTLITDNMTHNTSYYGGTFFDQYTTSTSHLSILDQHGNGVATTSTINGRFGSKRMGARTGIIFNNEMDDFSSPNITNVWGIKPSPSNFIVPGKRPLSSMCPTVQVDPQGDVMGVFGASGGSRITTAVAWVMAHTLWLGDDVDQAVHRPRLHHQLLPPFLQHEDSWTDKPVLKGLKAKGHKLSTYSVHLSVCQAIKVISKSRPIGSKGHRIHACSDYRKGGVPAGF